LRERVKSHPDRLRAHFDICNGDVLRARLWNVRKPRDERGHGVKVALLNGPHIHAFHIPQRGRLEKELMHFFTVDHDGLAKTA